MSNNVSILSGPVVPKHADLTPPDAPGAEAAVHARNRPALWSFVFQYWKGSDRWMGLSLMAISIAITFGTTGLHVWANKLLGEVTDALVNKKWDLVVTAFALSIAVGVASGVVTISNSFIRECIDLRWRTWLTDRLLARWTSASNFYDIERDGILQNADQRIAEDVRLFTDQTLNLFTSLLSVTVNIVTFTILLWTLSQKISFDLFGSTWEVAGYMVYIAYAYGIGGLLVAHFFGRQLMALQMQKQGVEADYRYLAMQLRENAEQVALYQGGPREHGRLLERFAFVKANFMRVIARTWKLDVARNTYGHLFDPLATVAALPLYFTGLVTFGGMTRVAGAFTSVKNSLSFFSQAYQGFVTWMAITNRLRDLSAALDAAESLGHGGFKIERTERVEIATSDIVLRTPKHELLCEVQPQCFKPGERWLVRGPSGTGKSTLLRAIAGIWPHGQGTVHLPSAESLLFLPQRSYIPSGSLAAAIAYPADPSKFTNEQLREALEQCGLSLLIPMLDAVDHWQRRLSGGEQQRLAFARAFLHKPAFVFLDEATSALDPETEHRLYQALMARLPGSAVISVAHRESVANYHDRVLELVPSPDRQPIAEPSFAKH